MNRYISSKTIKNDKKQRYLSTALLPQIVLSDADAYIEITSTERLDNLAQKFYDDVTVWPILANINGLGKGTLYVKPGTILRIPSQQSFTDLIVQLNNNR